MDRIKLNRNQINTTKTRTKTTANQEEKKREKKVCVKQVREAHDSEE